MIIGFVGLINSGKGSAGDILLKKNFIKESFAKGVKDVVSLMFNMPRHLLEGDTEESRKYREQNDIFWSSKMNKSFTPRMAMQLIGTDVGRNIFHEDFWIHSLQNRMDLKNNYVITDVRYYNEMEWIKSQGGLVINLIRGELPIWYEFAKTRTSLKVENLQYEHLTEILEKNFKIHESEYDHIGFQYDATIYNNGTLQDLENDIMLVLKMANFVI